MRAPWIVAALLASLSGPVGRLVAQDGLPVGARVRVSRPGRAVLTGSVARVTPDSFWLRLADRADPVPIGRREPDRVDLSRGSRSYAGQGALIGLGVGAVATTLFLVGFCNDPDTRCEADEYLRAALIIGTPPVLAGAGIGLLIRKERWQPLRLGVVLPLGRP